jgi:hypothetical protein
MPSHENNGGLTDCSRRTSSIVATKGATVEDLAGCLCQPVVGRRHAEEVSMATATDAGLKYVADTVYDV